jgi:hypothetical protein
MKNRRCNMNREHIALKVRDRPSETCLHIAELATIDKLLRPRTVMREFEHTVGYAVPSLQLEPCACNTNATLLLAFVGFFELQIHRHAERPATRVLREWVQAQFGRLTNE